MNTLLPLVLKNLRAARWWMALVWALCLAAALCPQRGGWPGMIDDWAMAASSLLISACLAVLFMQWWPLAEDQPPDSSRFIATRPVPGVVLFTARLVVLAGGGVLPFALAVAFRVATSGLGTGLGQAFLIAAEDAAILMGVLGCLTLRPALRRSTGWLDVAGAVLAIMPGIVLSFLLASGVHRRWLSSASMQFLSFAIVCATGAALWAALLCAYTRLHWLKTLGLAACAVLLAGWCLAARWSNIQIVPRVEKPADLQPVLRPDRPLYCAAWRPGEAVIYQHCHLTGLPPDVCARQIKAEGTVSVNGAAPVFFRDGHGTYQTLSAAAAAGCLRNGTTTARPWRDDDPLQLGLATIKLPAEAARDGVEVSLQGRYIFDLYRVEPVAGMPAETGRCLTFPPLRMEVLGTTSSDSGHFGLRVGAECSLRPMEAPPFKLCHGVDDLGWVVIDSASRQLYPVSESVSGTVRPLMFLQRAVSREEWNFSAPENMKLHPEAMRLALFRSVYIGTAAVPFTYEHQKLKVE